MKDSQSHGRIGFFGVAVVALAVLAVACHPWSPAAHVDGVHSSADVENVCIDMRPGADPTFAQARTAVFNVTEDEVDGWETRSTINIFVAEEACEDREDRHIFEIEFLVHNTADIPGADACNKAGAVSCWHVHGVPEHDTTKSEIHFPDHLITSPDLFARRHLINHEFGHAFGLDDVLIPKIPNKNGAGCKVVVHDPVAFGAIYPVLSIMHDSGCANVPAQQWPTGLDKASFDLNVAP